MATTKIWPVRGWLGRLVIYVENPAKTERPRHIGNPDILKDSAQGLEDVIVYAMSMNKTVTPEGAETMRYFVSGINCTPGSARDEMLATKQRFEKSGGIVAFHGYQSFKPGEVTPEAAHRIGVKLADKLWGRRFQVVVATHIDKGHIHNHFVINSVSFTDGLRFRSNKTTYKELREASDALCHKQGLSVIKDPRPGKSRHYTEWDDERKGKPTWRALIRADVDEAIAKAMTDRQFFKNLEALGYEIKTGQDISVRPPGKERFFRLARNFGDSYSFEGIVSRILDNTTPRLPIAKAKPDTPQPKKLPSILKGSIVGLYRHYRYLFGYYSRVSPNSTRAHFLLREDMRAFDAITAELALLEREKIQTIGQLLKHQESLDKETRALIDERKSLHLRARTNRQGLDTAPDNPRITEINKRLKTLRKEAGQCKNIMERSRIIEQKIEAMEQTDDNQLTRKEGQKDGRNRAGGRADSKDDALRL